jgi:hypothetical protein
MPGCASGYAVGLWWCIHGGTCHVIRVRCAEVGECTAVTPTPRPTPAPGSTRWPCTDAPNVYPGGIDQICTQWDWDLEVQVRIPPAEVLRHPWPRALVGLPTQIWYTGYPQRVEAFSQGRAFPCTVDRGRTYDDLDDVPACPAPVGDPTEGSRVNLRLGVAWQRWRAGEPGIYGYRPPHEVLISVDDRTWNSAGAAAGPYLEHTFETSSYGLPANGPRWNPACQDRDCACDERVSGWDMPAYQGSVQTWWYPQWTWRYDELQCTRREWSPCFYRAERPVGIPVRDCPDIDHYQIEECTEWRWRTLTAPLFGCPGEQQGAWCVYDLRPLGYNRMVPWAAAQTAGADASGVPCGSFTPGLAIPVIELQSVLVP